MTRLGGHLHVLDAHPVVKVYRNVFGIEEYHSHLRWRATKRYLDRTATSILEVGAGAGLVTFKVADLMPSARIVASEFEDASVSAAQRIATELGYADRVHFSQADLRELASDGETFDQALLIDVLEHIDDEATALENLARAIRPGGTLIVSTPTPNYPRIFGREFHESIGHVRDGYWLDDLQRVLAPAGFTIEAHHYYTGRLASRACSLFYRRGVHSQKSKLLLTPPLLVPGLIEPDQKPEHAASIALLARRT